MRTIQPRALRYLLGFLRPNEAHEFVILLHAANRKNLAMHGHLDSRREQANCDKTLGQIL
jgi:hypothetical protein